jgi:hypothetical protein
MVITTNDERLVPRAQKLAQDLSIPFFLRKKETVATLLRTFSSVIVVTKKHVRLYTRERKTPFFFHPGMAVVRIKRLLQGDNDIMVDICQIKEGDSFLDCTLGLAHDAIVASFAAGPHGYVAGVESQPLLAALVADGLAYDVAPCAQMTLAMRRIHVHCADYHVFLKKCESRSFDIVYFDPMFANPVFASSGMETLRHFANTKPLSSEAVREACRVAKRRVVMKEKKESPLFNALGFTPYTRPGSRIAYGVISV